MNFTQKDIEESRTAEIRGRYDYFASDDAVTDAGYKAGFWLCLGIVVGMLAALIGEALGWWVF